MCRREVVDSDEIKVYCDKGYSGKNLKRPAFTEMMEDVKRGLVNKLIVYRLDRFSRSIADFGMIWKILEKNGVEFVSVNEKFDTTSPIGVAMLNIIMTFAQLERQTIAERVTDNYYARARMGSWTGGPAPYGFKTGRVSVNGKPASTLIPDENADTVKEIFCEYAKEGASLGCVARLLNEKGVKNKKWDSAAVSRILHNPVYVCCDMQIYLYMEKAGVIIENPAGEFDGERAGMLTGKRSRSKEMYLPPNERHFALALHKGLIDPKLWLKCMDKLDKNRQIGNRGGKNSWLTGLIKCGGCGYAVKIVNNRTRRYLVCSGRTNYKICKKSFADIDIDKLETAVFGGIKALCENIALEERDIKIKDKQALYDTECKISRLTEALAEGSALGAKYITKEIEKLAAQRERLLKSGGTRITRTTTFNADKPMSCGEKAIIAAAFIEKIVLDGDTADVVWQV